MITISPAAIRPARASIARASARLVVAAALLAGATLATVPSPAAAADGLDPVVSTVEMLSRIRQPWVQLIDVRSADEYAGRDFRALRGGHIPGAINLPADEAGKIGAGGLDRRKETIVYGHDADSAARAAASLRALGFGQVRVYADAWQVWGNALELPVAGERYADVGAMRDRLLELQRELDRQGRRASAEPAGSAPVAALR